MNTLKEEANEYEEEDERIRVYLKIKPSIASDKVFYNVSKDKKILSLLDNITLDDQKRSKKIEIDKIFTNKEENSYIYEEVMLNCVNNSLDGKNFTFISYGDSNSDKHHLMIGTPDCYENINNRGIFPRLLENYINKIDSNEILSDSISLNLSYIMINNNNLIDLTQLMGRENKLLEKMTREELMRKYSKEIKIDENNATNINYLKSIKKTPVESANDSLFFLLQILNLFYKLEASSNHFLTWSYFIIILYVTDNNGKTVSTITFLIMPGNDLLYYKNQRRKSFLLREKKEPFAASLKNSANELIHVVEDILEQLDVKLLDEQKENEKDKTKDNNTINEDNKIKKNIQNKKGQIKSKLLNIIGNLAFDINNNEAIFDRRYIIIGSMYGNSGFILHSKDTLNILSQCKKFSGQKLSNKPAHFDNAFFNEKLKAKDDQIYDLESKLKTQESKVKQLNSLMESKEANLKALQENYREQIKSFKEELGFQGDINNLLKPNVNSEEYEFTLKIRNTTENTKLKNLKIEELKQQIAQIETVIQQLRTLLDVKENDATMLDIIRTVRQAKEKKREEMEIRNLAGKKIEDLEKKNKFLENKIKGYKTEISLKKKILDGLPEIFANNMNIKKNMNNLEIKLIDNDNSIKWFRNNKTEEINKIKTEANNEKNIIINKYENILTQNIKSIKDIGNKFNNITTDFQREKNSYLDELVMLYKFIIRIIIYYKKAFISNCSIFVNKEKFNKILLKEEKNINPINFPLLYDELGKIGYPHFQLNNKKSVPKKKIIKSKFYKNFVEDDDIKTERDENEKKEKFNFLRKSQRNNRIFKIIDIIKSENSNEPIYKTLQPIENEIIMQKEKLFKRINKKTESQLFNMSKVDLIQFCKNSNEKIEEIENFIKSNFVDKDNFDNFDPAGERIDEIKKKLKYINCKIEAINNKYKKNNVIFDKGDKVIQKLRNENHMLRKSIYDKDRRNSHSNFSPTFIHAKPKKYNIFNKTTNHVNINNFNSILTTTSSNGEGNNKIIFPNSTRGTRGYTGDNLANESNEKIQFNLTESNSNNNIYEYFRKRPISSINKINAYYMVGENL